MSNAAPKVFLFCMTKDCRSDDDRSKRHDVLGMAEDGTELSDNVCCSHGVGTHEDEYGGRQEPFEAHYPYGYELVWDDVDEPSPEFSAAMKRAGWET